MEIRAKLFGHPVHQMLIVFPRGLLATAVIFDVIRLVGAGNGWELAAWYMIAAGVIGGLVAAVFGLLDWLQIPGGTRARSVGALHGIGNVVVVAIRGELVAQDGGLCASVGTRLRPLVRRRRAVTGDGLARR